MSLPAQNNKSQKKRVLLAVTNDLETDKRVHKIAMTLVDMGFDVTLAGRLLPHSKRTLNRPYSTVRFSLWHNQGPVFYAFYNIRLFFHLIIKFYDIVVANDLDTLLGSYVATKIMKKALVYDSHEYFTEVPELVSRPWVKQRWEKIERAIVPELPVCYTVCDSIAREYNAKYGTNFQVVRNLPHKRANNKNHDNYTPPFPLKMPVIIYQGSVNLGRGIEEAIMAMHQINHALLVIVGSGDKLSECKDLVYREKLEEKVLFTGRISFEELSKITPFATIGLSIEKDMGLNYRYALPNKLFDYIQAGVPVLATNLPEVKKVVEGYNVGKIIQEPTPDLIAKGLIGMLADKTAMENWKNNCLEAARKLCWEEEEKKIRDIYQPFL
ncbi:MAG: glycosyltransferase [Prolixibacteraceae bacterium]|nr:glycosyltransferase [Prolixibacteraceae bacterium]